MGIIRKFIGLFYWFSFTLPLILIMFFLISANATLFNRSFYLDVINDPTLYDIMFLTEVPPEANTYIPGLPQTVDTQAFRDAMRIIITPEYFREQGTQLVNTIFDYLENPNSEISDLSIDLRPIREALNGAQGEAFAATLVQGLPVCAAGETHTASNAEIMHCIPEGMSIEGAQDLLLSQIRSATADEIANDEFVLLPAHELQASGLHGVFAQGLQSFIWIALIPLGLLTLFVWRIGAYIASGNKRGQLLWMSVTLGVPALLWFGIGQGLDNWVQTLAISETTIDQSSPAVQMASGLFQLFTSKVTQNSFTITGGVALGFSLGLFFMGLGTSRPEGRSRRITLLSGKPKRDETAVGELEQPESDDNPIEAL